MLNTASILEYQKGILSNVLALQPCDVCSTLVRSKIVFVAAQRLSRPSMTNFDYFLGFLMNSAENRIWQIKNFIIARCPSFHLRYMASVNAIQINPKILRKSKFALQNSYDLTCISQNF